MPNTVSLHNFFEILTTFGKFADSACCVGTRHPSFSDCQSTDLQWAAAACVVCFATVYSFRFTDRPLKKHVSSFPHYFLDIKTRTG